MIYIHSFSTIEQNIHKAISGREHVIQMDCKTIFSVKSLERHNLYFKKDVIVYSFLSLELFNNLDMLQRELEAVDIIVRFASSTQCRRFVVLTYPGAYLNSDNLYLQYRGLIEKKFIESGIPVTFLCVQGIYHPYMKIHNLHSLFFDKTEGKYIIPQKTNLVIYSVAIDTLSEFILESCLGSYDGFFDVFDSTQTLFDFLNVNSRGIKIQRVLPIYMYFKSYLGKSYSTPMLELFLRPTVPMFNYRTERIFRIKLWNNVPLASPTQSEESKSYKLPPVFGAQGFTLSS